MRRYRTTIWPKWMFPTLTWKRESRHSLYLTFDDGPTPAATPWVLNELAKVGAEATFFCLGQRIQQNKNLALETLGAGHTLGNHTFDHPNGWKISAHQYLENISTCDHQLRALNINSSPFRPPFGKITPVLARQLRAREIVMWSHLSWDFSPSFRAEQALKALKKAHAGDILLFHDTPGALPNLKKILPELLRHWIAKGLQLSAL